MSEVVRKPRKRLAEPRPPKVNSGIRALRPVLSFRVGEDLYENLAGSAVSGKMSISEVIERRLQGSFHAETLEALLRRVVREEIAADRKAQPRDFADHMQRLDDVRHAEALREIRKHGF